MLSSLSIVVPAFNEAASIAATVGDALRIGSSVARELEVLVCNDGSRDDTGKIVGELAAGDVRIRLLDRPQNAGIEASMRALYANARYDWVFLMSADRQWPMASLVELAGAAERGADFVIGVRPASRKRAVYTPYRRLVSWGYERIVRALGAPGGDPGSIKLARRELMNTAVASRGVFAEGERLIRAARSGARVVEVGVEFTRRGAGKATGARRDVVARALVDAARVTTSLLVGWPRPKQPKSDV
ncbi:MAG TPA: glycosyltransferase family 2 protein [Kofleriaceae bacterium]|nr:glycosyltransferase family 2 protein [Kofleriaceae bacterium]